MPYRGIKINNFSAVERQKEALKLIKGYPYTAKELSQELELTMDDTWTVLKTLEQQGRIICRQQRYQVREK